ncbi:MAG: lipoate--protein ligase family protein [Caldisericia bacterium]|nr:lipoate--protein ligase family protein [Caldisericia bacterium]
MKKTNIVKKKDVNFMGEKFRLIIDKIFDPAKHYALEEAMMRIMNEDESYPNTLRLRRVKKSVLIGFLENPYDTVNIDFALKNKVNIIRRHNLGGTVYQDLGSFMFTCLYRNGSFISYLNEEDTYNEFSELIILFLNKFGIKGKRRGLNDVVVNDKKIFGSSLIKLGDSISFTGTILVDIDLEFLSKVLKFINSKFSDKNFSNLKDALTTISIELNKKIKIKEAYEKFLESFKEKFNIDFFRKKIGNKEMNLMKKLYYDKYGKWEWTFGLEKDYEEIYTKKIKSGLVIIRGKFKRIIEEIKIYGDFLFSDIEKIKEIEKSLIMKNYDEAIDILKISSLDFTLKEGLIEILNEIKNEKRGQ